jgi:hypothetical protein
MRNRFALVFAWIVTWILALSLASADVTNPDFMPFGERAGMLGNAGFTTPTGERYASPSNDGIGDGSVTSGACRSWPGT